MRNLLNRVRLLEGRSLLSDPDEPMPLREWRDFTERLHLAFGAGEPFVPEAPPTRAEFAAECESSLDLAYAEPETTP